MNTCIQSTVKVSTGAINVCRYLLSGQYRLTCVRRRNYPLKLVRLDISATGIYTKVRDMVLVRVKILRTKAFFAKFTS